MQRALLRDENAVDSVERVIELVTLDAAYALSQDHTTGSIAVGKYADFVIINQDLLAIDPHKIGKTKVLLTVVGGRETYRAKRFVR